MRSGTFIQFTMYISKLYLLQYNNISKLYLLQYNKYKETISITEKKFPGPNYYEVEKKDKPGSKRAPAFSMAKRLEPPNSKYYF